MPSSPYASIYSLFIINKAGSLIYHREFQGSPNKRLTVNEMLVIASSFQSILAISAQLVPHSSSLRAVEGNSFRLRCFETPTCTKFIITTNKATTESVEVAFLQQIYQMYADYAMKNAFYTVEMPIKCHLFEQELNKLVPH